MLNKLENALKKAETKKFTEIESDSEDEADDDNGEELEVKETKKPDTDSGFK